MGAFQYNTSSKPSCLRTRADVHVAIDGGDITLDNTWIWHADHDDCHDLSDSSYSKHGLVVHGRNTIAIGLQVEHTMADLVVWKGEGGEVYMFQAELPYTDAQFFFTAARPGEIYWMLGRVTGCWGELPDVIPTCLGSDACPLLSRFLASPSRGDAIPD